MKKEETVTAEELENSNDENELLLKLEESEQKCVEAFDKYQRTLAEFDNFRKRSIKEKSAMFDDGACDIIMSLLPIIDNFERAFDAFSENDKQTQLYKGIEMIFNQFKEFMETKSITQIPTVGEEFNPELHAAVMHVDDESYGQNEVIEDMQKGYKFKERVIRHSVVKVAN